MSHGESPLPEISSGLYLAIPPPQALVITDVFPVSIIVPFPDAKELESCVAVEDGLISLSHMQLSFPMSFHGVRTPF